MNPIAVRHAEASERVYRVLDAEIRALVADIEADGQTVNVEAIEQLCDGANRLAIGIAATLLTGDRRPALVAVALSFSELSASLHRTKAKRP